MVSDGTTSQSNADAHLNAFVACGLFSFFCYVVVMSRAVYSRIQFTNRTHEVEAESNTGGESHRFHCYYWLLYLTSRTIEFVSLHTRVSLNRLMKRPQDSFFVQVWQAQMLRRLHLAVEVSLHTCALILLVYTVFILFGQAEWFSFLIFRVGSGGNGQLELVGLIFSACFFFWVRPEILTLRRAKYMYAIILAGLFMILNAEHSHEINTFTMAQALRIFIAFIFCNLPLTVFINLTFAILRVFYDLRFSSNFPTWVSFFKIEFVTLVSVAVACYIAESQVHEEVRFLVDSRIARHSESATKHLLGLLCDAAFYLGPELRLQKHSPELAALLLREGARSLEGCEFEELIQSRDRDRFNRYIRKAAGRPHELASIDEMNSFESKSYQTADRFKCLELVARSFSERFQKTEGPLVIHLNAASSTTVCVELFHIVSKDINERMIHLIGLRELQGSSGRNASIIQDLPPPEHLLFPLQMMSPLPSSEVSHHSSIEVASATHVQDTSPLGGLEGGGGESITLTPEMRLNSSGTSSDGVGSTDFSGVGSNDWSGVCDDTDARVQLEAVNFRDEDGVDVIALWFNASSTDFALLRTTAGFAKLGRPLRQGDSLQGILASDPSKLMAKVRRYVTDSKQDYTLYTDVGPEPFELGKLRFRLGYTLCEVSADCTLQLKPVLDPDSESDEEASKVLEACILLTRVKQSRASREKQ